MIVLELDTVLIYKKYKGKTVVEVIQFNFNYILWLIKNREEILIYNETLDFLITWSRSLGTGKTFIGYKEEVEIRDIIKRRWDDFDYETERSDRLQERWYRNREIDKDNEQAYEP